MSVDYFCPVCMSFHNILVTVNNNLVLIFVRDNLLKKWRSYPFLLTYLYWQIFASMFQRSRQLVFSIMLEWHVALENSDTSGTKLDSPPQKEWIPDKRKSGLFNWNHQLTVFLLRKLTIKVVNKNVWHRTASSIANKTNIFKTRVCGCFFPG